jgi:xylulokinase
MTGTSTVMIMPNDTGVTESAFIAMPHALPGINLLLGAMVSSGASLRWFRDQFADSERETAARTHGDAFDLLTAQAAQAPAGSDGLIFLPYMMGERSPLWNTHARGVLFGLSLATPKAAVIRAILEGTAYALRHNVEVAQKAGVPISEVRSVGGGTRSSLWNQIKADVLGVPVLLPEASVGAPFGDALVAGLGVGLYSNVLETVQRVVKIKTCYEPDAARHALYSQQYGLFRNIYEHLRTDFDDAARLMTSIGEA